MPLGAPSNPQATFVGLPAELRLHIYESFLEDSLVHLQFVPGDATNRSKFIWRACQAPNPQSPILCLNPKWSVTCPPEDRCGGSPDYMSTFPILLVRRVIYQEMKSMIRSHAAISMKHSDYIHFITMIPRPPRLALRRITLSGYHPAADGPVNAFFPLGDPSELLDELAGSLNRVAALPNLQQIAFQGKSYTDLRWPQCQYSSGITSGGRMQFRDWGLFPRSLMRLCQRVTVVFAVDALCHFTYVSPPEALKFTLIRKGKEGDNMMVSNGWADQDVEIWEERKSLAISDLPRWGKMLDTNLY